MTIFYKSIRKLPEEKKTNFQLKVACKDSGGFTL